MKTNIKYLLCFASLMILYLNVASCKYSINNIHEDFTKQTDLIDTSSDELLFHSGFEEEVALGTEVDQKLSIAGTDNSVSAPNDWSSLSPYIGTFKFEFEGGDAGIRKADIIQDPTNPSNKVLRYWLADANVGNFVKGRVQANAYGGSGIKELYQSVRMYLSPDFNTLKTMNASFKWLTLFEFWNNKTWGNPMPYPFRISVNIVKPTTSAGSLFFRATAQTYDEILKEFLPNWEVTNMDYEVPIGKWVTMEYYYKEGGASDGRFYLAMTPDGEGKVVLVDVNNCTRHPDKTNSVGLQNFNPMKLYTSKDVINFMKGEGKALEIYWDDFTLWKDRKPEEYVPVPVGPKVILKLDDLSAKNNTCVALPVMEYLINRKVKASYGVIASRLDATAGIILRDVLAATDQQGRPMIEIWNHGLKHDRNNDVFEFKNSSYDEQKLYLDSAHRIVKKYLNIDMVTFGAPFNAIDTVCVRVLHEHPSYKYAFLIREEVSYVHDFYCINDYVQMEIGTGVPDYEYFMKSFNNRSGHLKDVIFLQGHPHLWKEEGFEEFKKILDYLEGLGCEFIIPKMLSTP